ncbi:MAG: peptide chain release factor N(5)-glutamine methyltransferase [Gammaproteobacteria bacterium]|nr:peptide chain release factor N(5)-glutamine methyltransferase [Gammaproteobacteria bacterium]
MTNIKQAVQHGRETLNYRSENPQHEASLLLAHTIDKTKEYLIAHSEDQLSNVEFEWYKNYLARRLEGEPIAYIQQQKEFWSLPLKVTPGVLIPRPDTEALVEAALEHIPNNGRANILDLGTGSGCIALALAKERPNANIIACDNSELCIDTAKLNAESLNIKNITPITSDWFSSVEFKNFDLIISNPPYIAYDDDNIDYSVEKYEPETALFSRDQGLADLFHIIKHAPDYLCANGTLIVEHGFAQATDVRLQFIKYHYNNIQTLQDVQQNDRLTQGTISK